MPDTLKRLENLDTDKLIDVVKNYRQYGYDNTIREAALSILSERGINQEHLELSGNLNNVTYDEAHHVFDTFNRNSKRAFLLFIISLLTLILTPILSVYNETLTLISFRLNWIVLLSYFIFLIRSFMNQQQFYRLIGKSYGTDNALIYLLVGMPFYLFMFFYFRNQMKEEMKGIL